jgi:PAS domain S-box-containing protein
MAIPLVLAYFLFKRKDTPFPRIIWLFVAFIFLCGTTHLIEASIFWHPWYRLSGLFKVGTAVVSWATVAALIPIVPRLLSLPRLKHINTKLRREVEVRRAAEERFAHVFEAAPGAMMVVDARYNISMANALVEEIFGYTREEMLGQPVSMLLPLALRSRHEQLIRDYEGKDLSRAMGQGRELRGRHKNGGTIPLEIALNPLKSESEPMVLVVLADITSRKQEERRLATVARNLEHSNRELEQFAYVASHDLKAPLRAIKTLAGWVNKDVGDQLPDKSRQHLDKLQGRVLRMERLLDDLLEYSRVGRLPSKTERVDSLKVAKMALSTASPPEGFQITLPQEMPILETERVPLEQVLRNLFHNAIKHHDRGEGTIELSWRDQGDKVLFLVTDDGPGIKPEFHERIFQMFKTLRRRDEVEGSGMGLALIKKIVEHQGGSVHVESEPGQGATFGFTWPKQTTYSETEVER